MNKLIEKMVGFSINYLRRKNKSVIIDYRVEGELHIMRRHVSNYDSTINGINYLKDGSRFDVPKGRYRIVRDSESNE